MPVCRSCGAVNVANAHYCAQCGMALIPAAGDGSAAVGFDGEGAKTSALAIVALIFAIIPCTWIIGLVLGIIALIRISDRPYALKGRGLALGAIVLPAVWFVLGIVAAIAIPNFLRFQQRAKQSEAKVNLRAIYTNLRTFEDDHPGKTPATFRELDQAFEPHRRYAYFLQGDAMQPDLGGPYELPSDLDGEVAPPGVVVYAVANLDTDDTLDVWEIDGTGKLLHLRDDVTN